MSKSCRVNAYLVDIRPLHSRGPNINPFKSFDGSSSARDVVNAVLAKYSKQSKISYAQKTFKIKLNRSNSSFIEGYIHVGEYGFSTEIVDSGTGALAYKKGKHEADLEPSYFHLYMNDNENRGILCLQQTGGNGVKSVFETAVKQGFEANHPDYRIHIRPLVIADQLEAYIKKGVVEELILEKHEIPADIADRFRGSGGTAPVSGNPQKGTVTTIIKPSNKSFFQRGGLISYAQGKRGIDDVYDFQGEKFDVVKAKVRVGDSFKVLNITRPDTVSTTFDITDLIAISASGHPTAASLKKEFEVIAQELSQRGSILL